jgi:ligand-binding sensor domain-containing protein/signal transduction histidine kinase
MTARRQFCHGLFSPGTALLVTLVVWCGQGPCHAPLMASPGNYTIDVWQVEDGLPQLSVTSIKQTPEGYLWLGTFNGLVRFDGVRFTVFDQGNTPALGSSRIVRLDQDHRGGLWIITEDGALARLQDGDFRSYGTSHGVPDVGVSAVVRGPNGRALLLDRAGGVHELVNDQWVPDPEMEFMRGAQASLFTDPQDTLWVWFRDKRQMGRFDSGQLELLRLPDDGQDARVRSFAVGREGGLWLVVGYRIVRWHHEEWQWTDWELPEGVGAFTYMLEDRSGNLWVSSYGHGLFRFSQGNRCERFTTREGLSHNTLRALWEDFEGSIWVGTDGGGLNRLKPSTLRMHDTQRGLTGDVVMSISPDAQDPGTFWLGINGGGVNRLHASGVEPLLFEPTLRTNSYIYGLFHDRQGGLWIGSYDMGILRYHEGLLTRMTPEEGWSGRPLLAGLQDRTGRIWLGGGFGLAQWQDGVITKVDPPAGWAQVTVRAMVEDQHGKVYVGSLGRGLACWQEGEWQQFNKEDGLADDHITSLVVDEENTLWIGTMNGGLCRFRDGRFATVGMRQGLVSNSISSILQDESGLLWLGSNRGLMRIDPQELNDCLDGRRNRFACRVFNRSDGLNSIDCSGSTQSACAKGPDGRLWFATPRGVAEIDPNRLPLNSRIPRVIIEEVALDGIITSFGACATEGDRADLAIQILPDQHRLEIGFTALSLLMPEKVQFRYMLEGLDRSWVEARTRRTTFYTHIPPGEYRFRVIACNNDGVWNETGAVMAVTALPHYWQTKWFKALVVVGLCGGTGWLARLGFVRRMQRRLERLKQRQALEKERSRIARDLHDDLGSRLTQLGLLLEGVKRNLGAPEVTRSHLEQMTRRLRDTTQAMDEVVWAVDPAKDTTEGLMNYLGPLSGELLSGTEVRCRLEIPMSLPAHPVSARVRHGILLVVKEALNNSLKHSGASEIWIRGDLRDGILSLEIEDNGCGFRAAELETNGGGCGLRNMRHRVETLGGKFQVLSQAGRSTWIRLEVDLAREG